MAGYVSNSSTSSGGDIAGLGDSLNNISSSNICGFDAGVARSSYRTSYIARSNSD